MDEEQWLCGWREIGKYIKKSAKTAQRYAREGMPFFRDPGGRPIAKPSMIDEYFIDMNRDNSEAGTWADDGIETALSYEDYRERINEEFNRQLIEAKKPVRCRF